jgi:hypothetical protein
MTVLTINAAEAEAHRDSRTGGMLEGMLRVRGQMIYIARTTDRRLNELLEPSHHNPDYPHSMSSLTLERQIRPIYGVSAILYSLDITTAVATRRSGQWVP